MTTSNTRASTSRSGDRTKNSKATAMKSERPDRTSPKKETDQRGPADRDGNEGHARSTGAKGKPARARR
jgi:hypothetical protein